MSQEKNNLEAGRNSLLSRRKFLIGAGALATSGVLAATGLVGCGAKEKPAGTSAEPGATALSSGGKVPWKYQKLDVELVRKRGYEAYFKYG